MSETWISIERPPCARAFAVSVASWVMAMARTMDSPRPWWSSTRVRSSRWKGSKRRWTTVRVSVMLFMWRPGGANTVGMGDALVVVPGQLPLDQGAAQWASCQASRAGTSTLLDATVTTAKPGPDGRR